MKTKIKKETSHIHDYQPEDGWNWEIQICTVCGESISMVKRIRRKWFQGL